MNPHHSLRAAALSIAMVALATLAQAAAPTRVARLGYLDGQVSLLEAGNTDWLQAPLNQPITTGDQLWTDQSARVELQLEGATIRMGERSNVSMLNLDEQISRMQLSQGALRLRVRRLGPEQSIEVDTPNLALVLRRTGDYRIEVDPQGGATLVLVHSGLAEVFGGSGTYRVDNTQAYRFFGTNLSDYEKVSDNRADELDQWAWERERRLENSTSARYVPAGVVGYEDLDANGRWVVDGIYGNVWLPSRVDAGWTPYRDGRWSWVDPWGWTWIDNAPWGYAVSHYGRWTYLGNSWAWVPGATHERVVYAPALVVFVGNEQGHTLMRRRDGMGNTAWFPLGPLEVYRPEHVPTRQAYANQHVQGAIVVANQTPSARAPESATHRRPPRDNHPDMALRITPIPNDPARAERIKNDAARRDSTNSPAALFDSGNREAARNASINGENGRAEAARAEAAKRDAARIEEAKANTAKGETAKNWAAGAANAARADQGKQRGRDGDAQRSNTQPQDKKLTPEEELLRRGQRK